MRPPPRRPGPGVDLLAADGQPAAGARRAARRQPRGTAQRPAFTQAELARATGLAPGDGLQHRAGARRRPAWSRPSRAAGDAGRPCGWPAAPGSVAGVDFGHSHVAVAVGDLTGRLLAEERRAASTPATSHRGPAAWPRRCWTRCRAAHGAGAPRRPGAARPGDRRRHPVLGDLPRLGGRQRPRRRRAAVRRPGARRERRQPRRARRAPARRRARPRQLGLREDLLGRRRRHHHRQPALPRRRRHGRRDRAPHPRRPGPAVPVRQPRLPGGLHLDRHRAGDDGRPAARRRPRRRRRRGAGRATSAPSAPSRTPGCTSAGGWPAS